MPMKKDSLDGCSVHSRSSHTKDEFTSVTVRKTDPTQKSGIKLEQEEKTGRIKVKNIATNGLFSESEIEIGDILLSVNAKRLKKGEGPEKFLEAIKKARCVVTLVVKKSYMKPRVAPKKAKSLIQDNNVTKSKDSYYNGIAQHNVDGSLNFDACKVSKDKKKGSSKDGKPKKKKAAPTTEVTTITTSKVSGHKFIHGLEFEVKKSALYVKSMDVESAFLSTDIEAGDKILSINDMNFRSYADANYAIVVIEKAKDSITLVVEKVVSKKAAKSLFRGKKSTASMASSVSSMSDDSTFATDSSTATSDDDEDDDDDASFGALDDEMVLPMKSKPKNKKPKTKEVVISAPKEYFTQDPGITFRLGDSIGKMGKHGRKLIVSKIEEDSIFYNTSLEEGDVLIAVNGETFPDMASDGSQGGNKVKRACLACSHAKESISLLVAKTIIPQSQLQGSFTLDASATNLNWQ